MTVPSTSHVAERRSADNRTFDAAADTLVPRVALLASDPLLNRLQALPCTTVDSLDIKLEDISSAGSEVTTGVI